MRNRRFFPRSPLSRSFNRVGIIISRTLRGSSDHGFDRNMQTIVNEPQNLIKKPSDHHRFNAGWLDEEMC